MTVVLCVAAFLGGVFVPSSVKTTIINFVTSIVAKFKKK